MLNTDSLAQLQQLKADIRQEQRRYKGLVTSTQGSFGFVRADEGQQHFLPPQQMQKVFPGDRIEFQLKTDDQGREFAAVEKLLESSLKVFCGKCLQHGKAWFVDMDLPRLNRKLFLPPQQRKGVKPGDWLQCQVSRHPVKDGRGQAAVRKNLGQDSVADFPSRYASINFQLSQASHSVAEVSKNIVQQLSQRPEQTDLPLVSIDPPGAGDIDDALCAEKRDDGWELTVAIADPASVIDLGSKTGIAAMHRGATAYLPHRQSPMLPPELSHDELSLLGSQPRLAVICQLSVATSGEVTDARFSRAAIRSRAQLSYAELEQHLLQQRFPASMDEATQQSLLHLDQATRRMQQWRRQHLLMVDDRPEYHMQLGEDGRIAGFSCAEKGAANRLVEECMVATNLAAARELLDAGGLFNVHAGFRTEKLKDACSILKESGFTDLEQAEELNTLETYRRAMGWLGASDEHAHQKKILSRFLQRAALSAEPGPHLGMGVEAYASFTSPLRRYADFFNHVQLQRKLDGEQPIALKPEAVQQLEASLQALRSAAYWAEQWLKCEYLERQPAKPMTGRVVQANPFGLVVRLDENGIEGILEKRAMPGKPRFNPAQLRFKNEEIDLGLDDGLSVEISSIQRDKRQILFKLPA
jgi:ribonuclease R